MSIIGEQVLAFADGSRDFSIYFRNKGVVPLEGQQKITVFPQKCSMPCAHKGEFLKNVYDCKNISIKISMLLDTFNV